MMRRLCPLFALAVVAFAAAQAHATEMIEIPTPPPPPAPPPQVCCMVPAPPDDNDLQLLVGVDAGPTYRAGFGTGFAGGAVELMLGGEAPTVSFAGRFHVELGQTFGLPYEDLGAGMFVMGRLSSRVRLGGGFLFGVLMYQRASASQSRDPTVWAPSLGVDGEVTVDLVRTQRGGALFARGRVGYDYIEPHGGSGSSLVLAASLGYRY
jgi:hypothetical protein